ncbi:MAG TPA: error-prone DNA polymerase [Candidatus Binatia bacterium]
MTDGTAPYVELHCRSAFSFLRGASLPEDLVGRAATLGYDTLAIGDRDGVYGAPRAFAAARAAGIRALVGADVTLAEGRVYLLVAERRGYRNLCRLLTTGKLRAPKGECRLGWDDLEAHAAGLIAFAAGGPDGILGDVDAAAAPTALDRLRACFDDGRLFVEITRHRERGAERRAHRLVALAGAMRLPLVATNDVRHATPADRPLLDVLTCIAAKTTLDAAGQRLACNAERHLKPPAEMAAAFADVPEAVRNTRRIAERCAFTLADLGYRFPRYPVPAGETPDGHLRALTMAGARARYGALTPRIRRQLDHELAVIARLDLPGYFLIVWEIVEFCRRRGILVQGRGSAANSAVCYALGITAVDPIGMELLFERFLSEERGEWPDIDLDLPSGDRRETVIQHVYERYGSRGAAMTANVITYRGRSAIREVGKTLGFGPQQVDRLARLLSPFEFRDAQDDVALQLRGAGLDPAAPRVRLLVDLVRRMRGLPRHLGQHSGGLIMAAGRLDDVVPLEPASMPGRVVVQWDKDDCADLGLIKIDLLGLGMMAVLEDAIPLVREHDGREIDLAHLPADDPEVYGLLQRADTIGVFQVESRAQMATLPRLRPCRFYDLVVEVAIIRPGPIVGQMVHPYLRRRAGREPVTYPHPALEPILRRTLGVPLFQEQLLRIAMTVAGFSGGEAEELRRAMGFKRSVERMAQIEQRLRAGMAARGIRGETAETIIRGITSFALYGFPESHSASFALLAYASAYLKAHHPAAFFCALLNNWPMGFYHPATLVKDAERRDVRVLPIDVTRSGWRCTIEDGALRLGLRYVAGLREETARRLERERAAAPFATLADLVRRAGLREDERLRLARAGACAAFGTARRDVLWQLAALERDPDGLFTRARAAARPPATAPLPPMSAIEETLADYASTGLTAGPHLLHHLRPRLAGLGVLSSRELRAAPDGHWVRVAGHVIVRQRPGTAKGMLFLTLEDETGTANAVITPPTFQRHRRILQTAPVLVVEGPLQRVDGVTHVQGRRFHAVTIAGVAPPAHDFH